MLKISFSKDAKASILSIGRYTEEKWGYEKRKTYIAGLFATFSQIRKTPYLGKP